MPPQVMQCKKCSEPMIPKVSRKESSFGKWFVTCKNNCPGSFRFTIINGSPVAPKNPDGSIDDNMVSSIQAGYQPISNNQVMQAAQSYQQQPPQQQQHYQPQQAPQSPPPQQEYSEEVTVKKALIESLLYNNKMNNQTLIDIYAEMTSLNENITKFLATQNPNQPAVQKKRKFIKEPAFEDETEEGFISEAQQGK